ncbi:MAG: YggS family pyridoxal phosphate-dependent enzyme [Armatimonadetes bacterium]|nr:YggS family pyridoxal phosphate-dependent enzyme [Armatimonadota bacterium]
MPVERERSETSPAATGEVIRSNWEAVVQRARAAALRAGRDPKQVTIVAVTKTHPAEIAAAAVRAGVTDLGENYVQEMLDKQAQLEAEVGTGKVRWHFVGHLQRNKAKYLPGRCHLVHSVDSTELAQELDRRAQKAGVRQAVLIEVNVGGESSKFGVPPEKTVELARQIAAFEHLDLQGLMTVEPLAEDVEMCRPVFRRLRQLAEECVASGLPPETMRHLSMGMTQDFEVAIEEGATIVRVGTAIFGPRRT